MFECLMKKLPCQGTKGDLQPAARNTLRPLVQQAPGIRPSPITTSDLGSLESLTPLSDKPSDKTAVWPRP